MFSFENLNVYQKALEFTYLIYKLTNQWPKSELYGLTSQLRRSALSIVLNIAEGSSRSKKEYRHFLDIARGSCYECVPILKIALNNNLVSDLIYARCYDHIEELTKMINGLKRSLTPKANTN